MIEKNVSNPEVKKNIITYVLPRFVDRLKSVNNTEKSSSQVSDLVPLKAQSESNSW